MDLLNNPISFNSQDRSYLWRGSVATLSCFQLVPFESPYLPGGAIPRNAVLVAWIPTASRLTSRNPAPRTTGPPASATSQEGNRGSQKLRLFEAASLHNKEGPRRIMCNPAKARYQLSALKIPEDQLPEVKAIFARATFSLRVSCSYPSGSAVASMAANCCSRPCNSAAAC